jgi:hypothetical protein
MEKKTKIKFSKMAQAEVDTDGRRRRGGEEEEEEEERDLINDLKRYGQKEAC